MNRGLRYLASAFIGWILPASPGFALEEEDIPEQSQISLTVGSSGTWNADWQGVEHRVYFLQWSWDLVTWNYAPFMEFGTGLKSKGCISTSEKFFIRLRYADADEIDTLEDAETADFDGDGVPNLFEVETVGSDPFDGESVGGDSDNDEMADGWELYYFGNLEQSALGDEDGDGVSNADEFSGGSNPKDIDTDGDGIPDNIDADSNSPEVQDFMATSLMVISPLQ